MARADEKTRIAFWIENELIQQCDDCWKSYRFASRNEFVNKAIEHFIATQTLDRADGVLADRLAASIAKAADDGMVKISKGLFRYAVGQEMIMHILAKALDISEVDIAKLRGLAIKNVRKTRGKVRLETIADFQNESEHADEMMEDARSVEERLEDLLQVYLETKDV